MIEELNGDFLQWLRGFYYIVQTGSIRGAAQMMHRNPSTISYQLRCLENELNTVLFDRHKKSLRITPEGERLLAWTISTFETLRGMRSDVSTIPGTLQGSVAISSNLPFAVQVVKTVATFCSTYPKVHVKLLRALDLGVMEDVAGARVDFGLVAVTEPPAHCRFEALFPSRPLLLVHQGNTYNLPDMPGPEDIKGLPLVSFLADDLQATSPPHLITDDILAPIGEQTVLCVNNYHLMLRYVLRGIGAAIMDEMCFRSSCYGSEWQHVIAYPLDGLIPTVTYGILIRDRKHLSPQAQGLMDAIRQDMSNLDVQVPPTRTQTSSAQSS